jgi:hypothetical protein
MPLQAADLWAWRSRAYIINELENGTYDLSLFKRAERLKALYLYLSPQMLYLTARIMNARPDEVEELRALLAEYRAAGR